MTNAVNIAQSGSNNVTFRNKIINGAMVLDQRNAGASVTPTNDQYLLDRWIYFSTQTSKVTCQQNQGSVTPPAGFTNYFGFTSSSAYSLAAGDYFATAQSIEGYNVADLAWGTANAKPITLSFWVRSSLTGTFGAVLNNAGNSRSYPFTYTISAANTWEQKSVTIAGDTSGTWTTTNGIGLRVLFSLGVGTTYSGTAGAWAGTVYLSATGATSVVGTNGATFYITGVQLEAGTTASPFEYRQYGTELALCQRYYEYDAWQSIGANTNGSNVNWTAFYKVTKRANPTLTVSGTVTFQGVAGGISQGSASGNINALNGSASRAGSTYQAYYVTSDSGGWTASAEL
jgi:hypothetical protein